MKLFLDGVALFFLIYMTLYATYLFVSVAIGALDLYREDKMRHIKNELKHDYYFPVSLLVPAYNEEVTILESVSSLLDLDYRLYEVLVIDDGSIDHTAEILIEAFQMQQVNRPIRMTVPCRPVRFVYEAQIGNVRLTLICKENGGKGDALNMGINASSFPYFICIDADSMLQKDSLERIVQPVMADDTVVAVGGMVRVIQDVEHLPRPQRRRHLFSFLLNSMQTLEYDRSFLASRILLDNFNGNLIISGAFGLFKKDVVIAAGGYDTTTLGEDMELVMKLHAFCRSNRIPYSIRYAPGAICWSQAPSSFLDLGKQRRRWHLGLFQSLTKYRHIFFNRQYGMVGTVSYLYYLVYELLSPFVEVFGLIVTLLACAFGYLDFPLMISFYLLYAVFGSVLTLTAFFQRVYTQGKSLSCKDVARALLLCLAENILFHFFLAYIRSTAFIGYRQKRLQWGEIQRKKQKSPLP